jgi:hypothetical protein
MKLSNYPTEKIIDGKTYKRSSGGLYSNKSEAEKEKKTLSPTHFVRMFWTGGERLSNGSIRKSYFLLIRKK